MTEKRAKPLSVKTRLTGIIPPVVLLVLILYSFSAMSNPFFYSPAQQYRAQYANEKRIVTSIYFYWYQSRGANFSQGMSNMEFWHNSTINSVAQKQYPSDWPGPTSPSGMIVDTNASGGWHDSNTYHDPAQAPEYDAYGNVIPGTLKNGTLGQLGSWIDLNNTAWHEWQMRCMMRAGIDVLMPDDWYNGVSSKWSMDALRTLKVAWYDLANNVTSEANAKDGGARNISYGYGVVPKIAMFFDTTCMRELWAYNMSHNDTLAGNQSYRWYLNNGTGPDLRDPYWINQFWNCIDYFYSVLDTTCEFIWHGSCLVWLYGAGWVSNVGTQVFAYYRQKFEAKYHLNLTFIGGSDWLSAGVDGVDPWGACFGAMYPYNTNYEGIPCGAVGPGIYNLGAIAIEPVMYKARDPSRYQAEWQAIIDQGAVFIHVETWNELHEGTGICWTQEHGFTWIDLTRQMADKAHAMTAYSPVQAINWPVFVPVFILFIIVVVSSFGVAFIIKKPEILRDTR